jgi:hypothetical protein
MGDFSSPAIIMGLWKRTCEFLSRKIAEAKTFNETFNDFFNNRVGGGHVVCLSG